MKTPIILHLAALSAAFVLPNEQLSNLEHVEIERHPRPSSDLFDTIKNVKEHHSSDFLHALEHLKDHVVEGVEGLYKHGSDKFETIEKSTRQTLDEAITAAKASEHAAFDKIYETYFDAESWLDSFLQNGPFDEPSDDEPPHHGPPHHGPPHHGPPKDGHPPHDGPPHHGPPFHHKSNLTVYQLISKSNYTTKLAKLIDKYDDLVEALNSTDAANYTVFAPTDRAFAKIPEHAPTPSEAQLKALLQYHVSGEFYPAGRILTTRTIPSLYVIDTLGDKPHPQRLSTNLGLRGLTVNFYSRVVAVDIFGSNGVIHGVDSIIIPPPKTLKIIDILPGEFSTLALGLSKTGLYDELNGTDSVGGTFFAPSNFAFQKLGPRINAFLFSPYGLKYLKALLQYHVVTGHTLYSDAYYGPSGSEAMPLDFHPAGCHKHARSIDGPRRHHKRGEGEHDRSDEPPHHGPPKGLFHIDLPTLLEDRSLSIDIARYGRLIEIKINGFSRVVVSDGVASDGVIHVVGDVLIPPKKVPGLGGNRKVEGEMTVEELKERLLPFIEDVTSEVADDTWTDL